MELKQIIEIIQDEINYRMPFNEHGKMDYQEVVDLLDDIQTYTIAKITEAQAESQQTPTELGLADVSVSVCPECGCELSLSMNKRLYICDNDICDYTKRANEH